jgi:hypothetical protein
MGWDGMWRQGMHTKFWWEILFEMRYEVLTAVKMSMLAF